MNHKRDWNGDEWQRFSLQLVQLRHGHENIQCVPDAVRGDAGIEFIFVGGTLYQCYAPEEVRDTQKAATAQRSKATRDLNKLRKNQSVLERLLDGLMVERWILLCPFLDDKEVVAHVRKHGIKLRDYKLPFLDPLFEALVHSQTDFTTEIEQLRRIGGMPIKIDLSVPDNFDAAKGGAIGKKVIEKLTRAYGDSQPPEEIEKRRDAYVKAHAQRDNALEDLRANHPALWERSIQCLDTEEQRLVALGATSTVPAQNLHESVDRIEQSLKQEMPNLPGSFATSVALGTVSDWLFRCPLDFPAPADDKDH